MTYLRYRCPYCQAAGAHPDDLPAPFCYECPGRVPMAREYTGHNPAQISAIARVRAKVGADWLTDFERHLVAGFVVSNEGLRKRVLNELAELPPGARGTRLLPHLQEFHAEIERAPHTYTVTIDGKGLYLGPDKVEADRAWADNEFRAMQQGRHLKYLCDSVVVQEMEP